MRWNMDFYNYSHMNVYMYMYVYGHSASAGTYMCIHIRVCMDMHMYLYVCVNGIIHGFAHALGHMQVYECKTRQRYRGILAVW